MSKKRHDATVNKRMREREKRIKEAGLSHLKVIMHKEDANKIRSYAKKLYEKRYIKF